MLVKWVLVILATLALLGAGVAMAASISVGGVDKLGSVSAPVLAPSPAVTVTDVKWTLDSSDTTKVLGVTVTIAPIATTTYDSLHLVLKDSFGGVLQQKTFTSIALDGAGFNTISWPLSPLVPAASIFEFAITVIQAVP